MYLSNDRLLGVEVNGMARGSLKSGNEAATGLASSKGEYIARPQSNSRTVMLLLLWKSSRDRTESLPH